MQTSSTAELPASPGLSANGVAPSMVERFMVGALVALGLALLALEDGAYDIVIRQQAAIVIWWALALGALFGLLPRTLPSRTGGAALGALALLAVWSAASLAWSSSDDRTLAEVARIAAHLGALLIVSVGFGREHWRSVICGAIVAGVFVCGAAFGSRMSPGLLGTDAIAQATGQTRLNLPFNYWNALGAWAGMSTIAATFWSAHVRNGGWRGLALAAVPVTVVVGYLTLSRAAIIGAAAGVLAGWLLSRNRWTALAHIAAGAAASVVAILQVRKTPEIAEGTGTTGAWRMLAVLVACAAVLAVFAWFTGRSGLDGVRLTRLLAKRAGIATAAVATAAMLALGLTVVPDAWDQFTTPAEEFTYEQGAARLANLNSSRYPIYRAAVRTGWDNVWGGSAAGTWEFTWNQEGTEGEFLRDAHSLYFETFSELGAPGLILVLAFVGLATLLILQTMRATSDAADRGAIAASGGALAAFAVGAGVDWLWESTAVAMLAMVLLGALIARGGRQAAAPNLAVRLGAAGICLLVVAVQLPGLISTSEIRTSQAAAANGELTRARSEATDAVDSAPWAATPLIQRALVHERAGDLNAARRDLVRAFDREPENWRVPLLLARIEARRGEAKAALANYRQAKRLRPSAEFFLAPSS